MCVGSGEDLVSGDLGSDQLADDVAVGESNNKSVFGSVVLVLGLCDQSLTGIVVSLEEMLACDQFAHKEFASYLSGPSTLVLCLESGEVR